MFYNHLKFIAILLTLSLFSGCFVRDEVRRFREQLNRIEEGTIRIEEKAVTLDSLSREEIELIIKFRAQQQEALSQIKDNMESTRSAINELAGISTQNMKDTSISSDLYSIAYSDYLQGNYDLALSGFLNYLNSISNLDEVRYFIGECYLEDGEKKKAISSFERLLEDHPQSKKVPTTLYKMGKIYEEIGDTLSAKEYFNGLILKYPDSPESALIKGIE